MVTNLSKPDPKNTGQNRAHRGIALSAVAPSREQCCMHSPDKLFSTVHNRTTAMRDLAQGPYSIAQPCTTLCQNPSAPAVVTLIIAGHRIPMASDCDPQTYTVN